MLKNKINIIIIGLILSPIIYLVFTATRPNVLYWFTVEEVHKKGESIYGEEIRVQGIVVNGSISRNVRTQKLSFEIADKKNAHFILRVLYKGNVPDFFEESREVVVEGKHSKEGTFFAKNILLTIQSK